MKIISSYQFACFRIIFGIYLTIHFAYLIPYGGELFSREGVLPDFTLNLTHQIFPNLLAHFDSPIFITFFLGILTILSLTFTLGFYRRWMALFLWYGWACLFNRNNLISNPSLPYVGLLLIFMALIPEGEPFSLRRKPDKLWFFPVSIFWSAWFLLGIGYTFSGYTKLFSPSWVDGSAFYHLAMNPLARPGIFRDGLLLLPDIFVRIFTWSALVAELLFLPMIFHRVTRLVAWVWLIAIHLGILAIIDFADLTWGMLMIHFFVFDPDWFPARKTSQGKILLLFDGICGLCNKTVRFLSAEDRENLVFFAPLQGKASQSVQMRHANFPSELKTLVLVENWNQNNETIYQKSEAVLKVLDSIGGMWRVVSWLRIIPQKLRDRVYDWVAKNRYRWFGKSSEACEMPSPSLKTRLLD